MPIFEFRCSKCGRINEFICSVGGQYRPTDVCVGCGGTTFVKIPSVPSDPRGGDTPVFGGKK